MSLVKLKDAKGNVVYLNPAAVALVSASGAGIVGESSVVLINGLGLAIDGSPAETSDLLNGGPDISNFKF